MKVGLTSIFIILLMVSNIKTHDYWLEPEQFFLTPGDKMRVSLFVGDGFKPEITRELQKSMTPKFRLISANAEVDLLAAAADSQ